jgi:hypothetical protein
VHTDGHVLVGEGGSGVGSGTGATVGIRTERNVHALRQRSKASTTAEPRVILNC